MIARALQCTPAAKPNTGRPDNRRRPSYGILESENIENIAANRGPKPFLILIFSKTHCIMIHAAHWHAGLHWQF